MQSKSRRLSTLNLPSRSFCEQQSNICLIIYFFLRSSLELVGIQSQRIIKQQYQIAYNKQNFYQVHRPQRQHIINNTQQRQHRIRNCQISSFFILQTQLIHTAYFLQTSNPSYYLQTEIFISKTRLISDSQRQGNQLKHHMATQQVQNPQLLSGAQTFERILISSPIQDKQYTNLSFKNVEENVIKQIQKLMKTSFYTQYDVYLGAQKLSKHSYLQEKYKREEEILKLQIQQTRANIRNLKKSNNEVEFDNHMKTFLINMDFINSRSQDVDHQDFVPCIYIQAKKKKPFYGHLMQEFNRKGTGMLNVKAGYRSPFAKFDTIQLKYETPLASLRRKYFNLDLEWNNPSDKYGNIFARISSGNANLFKDIDEKSHSLTLGFNKQEKNLRFQWQNKFRNPYIHSKFDQYCSLDYHLPSLKSSFKLTKVWQNTIQWNDINMGKIFETKGQVTLPYVGKSQFVKFETNYRKFYDTINLKKYFDNQLMKKLLFKSSIETNLSWNIIKNFSTIYVSDINDTMEVRGFDSFKNPTPTFTNCKLSAKFNIHNFPLISQARITPFFYLSAGCSLLDLTNKKKVDENPKSAQLYGLGSVGMGLAYYINQFAQIQLVYSLAGIQNLPKRTPTGFQIRVGVFD